jgi:hypothetical protein
MRYRMKVFCICISALIGVLSSPLGASTYIISKSDLGIYHTIQEAVNAAKPKDTILIIDSEIYEECVTIAFKKDLTIKSIPTLPVKPTISFQDKENTGPTTCEEAKDSATVTYQKNGALRILESSNITIEGLIVDGKEAYAFGYPGIWEGSTDCQWSLQSGNASIALYRSSNVIIDNCEIDNAFFGIYIVGFNNTLSDGRSTQPAIPTDNTAGCTGNHLITACRIHHNSFGLFFENDHDMGITIHNNLFYNNRHSSETVAMKIKALTSEGNNLPSGAILFKNLQKTPIAIYNNTFYNNFLLFTSHWRPGNSYLIFNNIYGPPYTYWTEENVYQNSFMASDGVFSNRTFNCLYACQTVNAKPIDAVIYKYDIDHQNQIPVDTIRHYQTRIMNNMGEVEGVNIKLSYDGFDTTLTYLKLPGNRIIGSTNKAFPVTADVRWLEPKFKSTDPSSAEFLVPDWNDSLMHSFIPDKGWAASGVRDADGSIADLGAISSCGTPLERIRILPATTLTNSLPETIPFYLVCDRPLNDCRVEYCRFIDNSIIDSNAFGGNGKVLESSQIHDVITEGNVKTGLNLLRCTINGTMTQLRYGYFEMVVSGINDAGIRISSTPGFIPVSVPSVQPNLEISFTIIDTSSINKNEETIEFVLRSKPGAVKAVFHDLSLLKIDGSGIINIHGTEIHLDSLLIPSGAVTANDLTTHIDTFTVAKNAIANQVLMVLLKAKTNKYVDVYGDKDIYTYSTHIMKLSPAISAVNYFRELKLNKSSTQPQSAAIYNLMGKKIVTIPFSNFSIPRVQSTLSRGVYIARFLQVNGNQIKEAGTTKFIVQ